MSVLQNYWIIIDKNGILVNVVSVIMPRYNQNAMLSFNFYIWLALLDTIAFYRDKEECWFLAF